MMHINNVANTLDSTYVDTSMVDLIQGDELVVTTVAEAKKNKVARQINLATIVQQLMSFTTEDIANYPVNTIYELADQSKRIEAAYEAKVQELKSIRNA